LSDQERAALSDFAICWTIFESKLFDSNVSAARIKEKVESWFEPVDADKNWYSPQFEYFRGRYTENGEIGARFGHLHLRNNDDPDLVRQVLLGEDQEAVSQLTACLIIVSRFRNNFFHGLKWAYQFQDQHENFENSTKLMIECITKFGN